MDAANGVEREPTDRTLVELDKDKPTSARVLGTTLPDGEGVPESPAGAAARGSTGSEG